MRWKPLNERELPAFFGWIVAVMTFPVWGMLFVMIWLDNQKAKLIGPSSEWRPWFAWHPVQIFNDDGFHLGPAIWLEWVERRRHWNMAEFRLANAATAVEE